MSSFATSQQLSTNQLSDEPSVQISKKQVSELYKIGKQNEYLKDIYSKQDRELKNAVRLIDDQKNTITKCNELVRTKDEYTKTVLDKCSYEKEIKDVEIERLNELIDINKKLEVKSNRNNFWKGFAAGGTTVAILGSLLLILK